MAASSKSSIHLAAFGALSFAVLTWGVSPVFVRSLALATGPADSIVIRMWSVAIVCLPLLAFAGWRIERQDILRLVIAGSIGNFGYFLGTIFGFTHVSAGIGGIIIATQPLLIALLAAAIGLEKLNAAIILGIIISFGGTIWLVGGGGGSDAPGGTTELVIGSAMIFMSGVAWAIYVVLSKPLIQKYGAMTITAYSLILCAPPTLVFVSSTTWHALTSLTLENWASLFYLSIIATFIALTLWNFALGHLKSSTVGATLYLVPILSLLAGWIFLNETITLTTILAGFVILLGVAVAQFGTDFKLTGSWQGYAAVIFAVLCWGLVPVCTRYMVLSAPTQTVMILRVVPAGVLGLIIAAIIGMRPMPMKAWARVAGAAIIGNVGYQVLSIIGAQYVPSSWMGMLFGLEPMFIALFAVIFAGDRINIWLVGGLILSLFGTVVLMFGNLFTPVKDVSLFGIVMVTLGTMGWGIYTIMVRPVSRQYGAVPVACLTLGFSALPMVLFFTPELPSTVMALQPFQWLVISFVVLFCTIGGTLAWNYALGYLSSSIAGMFLYVQPIVAAFAGVILLHEQLSLPLVLGGAIIIAGVALAQFGPLLNKTTNRN